MQYNMIDPNSVQYKQHIQGLRSLRRQVILWLLVLALGVLLIPLMLISGWVRSDATRVEDDLMSVQSALSAAGAPSAEVNKLNTDIAGVNHLVTLMETVTVPSGVNWPLVINAAMQYDPAGVQITSLTQTDQQIQLAGRATNNDAVVQYQKSLIDSGAFRDVQVISLSTAQPTPIPVAPTNKNKNQQPTPVATAVPPFGDIAFVIDLVVADIGADRPAGTPSP
jgi:Tfp pilus assembly protein PilN